MKTGDLMFFTALANLQAALTTKDGTRAGMSLYSLKTFVSDCKDPLLKYQIHHAISRFYSEIIVLEHTAKYHALCANMKNGVNMNNEQRQALQKAQMEFGRSGFMPDLPAPAMILSTNTSKKAESADKTIHSAPSSPPKP